MSRRGRTEVSPRVAWSMVVAATLVAHLHGTTATLAPPTLTSVSPAVHPTTGNTLFTLIGTNFGASMTVTVDGSSATGVAYVSTTKATATSPVGTGGGVTVQVIFSNQTNPLNTLFSYSRPTVDSATPNSGSMAGGYTVTVDGSNFGTTNQNATTTTASGRTRTGLTVSIQGRACTSSSWSSNTRVFCTTAPNSGAGVNVAVTIDGQTSSANTLFSHAPPTVTAIDNTEGTTYGGTTMVVTGTNFGFYDSTPVVGIGTTPCATTSYISDTTMRCILPKVYSGHTAEVHVTITSQVSTQTAFTYTFIANHTEMYSASAGQTYRLGDDATWTLPIKAFSRSRAMYLGQVTGTSTTNANTAGVTLNIPSGRMYSIDQVDGSFSTLWDLDGTLQLETVPVNTTQHLRLYRASSTSSTSWTVHQDIGTPSSRAIVSTTVSEFGVYVVAWSETYVSSFSPANANPSTNVTFTGYGLGKDSAANQKIWLSSNGTAVPCAKTIPVDDTQLICTLPSSGLGQAQFIVESNGVNFTVPGTFTYRLDGSDIQVVEAYISGSNLVIEYVKNTMDCLHLVLSTDVYLTPLHSRNLFCNQMDPVVITAPLTFFNYNITVGTSVRLVHGNLGSSDFSAAYTVK